MPLILLVGVLTGFTLIYCRLLCTYIQKVQNDYLNPYRLAKRRGRRGGGRRRRMRRRESSSSKHYKKRCKEVERVTERLHFNV
jgi:hypothetical protein